MGEVLHPKFGIKKRSGWKYKNSKRALVVVVNQEDYDRLKIACREQGKDEHELATMAIQNYLQAQKPAT